MSFKHFIITRFNLQLYSRDKHRQPTRTDEWLRARFDVFETYCLPSIAGQEDKNFTWLVLFDAGTPEPYRVRIAGFVRDCPQLVPLYYTAAQVEYLTDHIRTEILSRADGATHVLTTNLDNDDALSIHWVGELAGHVGAQLTADGAASPVVYSFNYGFQYFTGMRMAIGMRLSNNHFLSLLEPLGPQTETIIAYRHAKVTGHFATRYLDSPRGMWLEVVHASNVSNDLRIYNKVRYLPVLSSRPFADFGSGLKMCWARQWLMTFIVLPFKFIVTGMRRLATKGERMKHSKNVKCETTDTL
jgi:hypothetical protein